MRSLKAHLFGYSPRPRISPKIRVTRRRPQCYRTRQLHEKGLLNAMAKYYSRAKSFSRDKGGNAILAAAQRSALQLRRMSSGQIFDLRISLDTSSSVQS
jgi:hypothetical protein